MKAEKQNMEAFKRGIISSTISRGLRDQAIQEEGNRTLSSTRARVGASGVAMEGSPLDVYLVSAKQIARDIAINRMAGDLEVEGLKSQIDAASSRSQYAALSAIFNTVTTMGKGFATENLNKYTPSSPGGGGTYFGGGKPSFDLSGPKDWKWGTKP